VNTILDKDFDFVITVCNNAKESCPTFHGKVENKFHIGFADPAEAVGTEEEVLNIFRKVRDEINEEFCKLYKNIQDKDKN
jgi:arsenate reductase